MEKEKGGKVSLRHRILTIIGIVLCIVLIPILIINCTLIIKSYTNTDKVPDFFGVLPMIVNTGSMEPEIMSGDLILCHTVDPEDVQVGDVITFFDPVSNAGTTTTHRVLEVITQADGTLAFRTQGDANNAEDPTPVPADKLVGRYQSRIPGAGSVALFMQSTAGLVVCVVLPLLLLVGYDFLRRRQYDKAKQEDTKALLAELEALRAQKETKEN